MANKTIPQLAAALVAALTDVYEIDDGSGAGGSKKVTGAQLLAMIFTSGNTVTTGPLTVKDTYLAKIGRLSSVGTNGIGLGLGDGYGIGVRLDSGSTVLTYQDTFGNYITFGSTVCVIETPTSFVIQSPNGGLISIGDAGDGIGVKIDPQGTDLTISGITAYNGNFQVLTALPSTFKTVTVTNGIITSVA